MPSPTLSPTALRAPSPPPSTSTVPAAASSASSRRWASRLRGMLSLRALRRPSSVAALSTDSAAPSATSTTSATRAAAARRRHRHRGRRRTRHASAIRPGEATRLSSRAVRFPPEDSDTFEPPIPQSYPLRRTDYPLRRTPSAAVVSSALAEIGLDATPERERELFAVVNRIFDEYNVDPRLGPGADISGATPFYQGRLPPHTRRVAMRVQNAYYIAGQRRSGRHSHLTTELERDIRWGVRTLRLNADAGAGSYDYAASDDQIEALPTFVMEKGETRSVQQIFAAMGAGEHEKIVGGGRDECGGLMTSYTECAICLSDFEAGDEITLLPCGHFFHLTGCVREWLRNHARTCPTCRADICNSNTSTGSSDGLASHSATVATSEEIS